ncbi:hypothetical protein A2U01_0027976 [Trifolium medium]|uniref:Uncharacterized protein n=1 Tax=Trifolium medium TaxID=97028 RepID=A0A392P597_9FABA|nr:hypothetical protein [Trifolium medium]
MEDSNSDKHQILTSIRSYKVQTLKSIRSCRLQMLEESDFGKVRL